MTNSKTRRVVREEPVAYCGECGHAHDSHSARPGTRCSYDWCPCTQSVGQVQQNNPATTRQVFAATPFPAGVAR